MSDHDYMAGYVTCYTCGASNSVLVGIEIHGTKFDGFDLKVIQPCECGRGFPAKTRAWAENEEGIHIPPGEEDPRE